MTKLVLALYGAVNFGIHKSIEVHDGKSGGAEIAFWNTCERIVVHDS